MRAKSNAAEQAVNKSLIVNTYSSAASSSTAQMVAPSGAQKDKKWMEPYLSVHTGDPVSGRYYASERIVAMAMGAMDNDETKADARTPDKILEQHREERPQAILPFTCLTRFHLFHACDTHTSSRHPRHR